MAGAVSVVNQFENDAPGAAKQSAEKLFLAAEGKPQALKRKRILSDLRHD
jgi:hypothetical protein